MSSFRCSFFVPGPQVGKGRARSNVIMRGGRPVIGNGGRPIVVHHTPQKTVNYEATVKLAASEAMQDHPPFEGPLRMTVCLAMQIPQSYSRKKREQALSRTIFPTKKPDVSNVLKAIEDACNGVVYRDDVQIVSGSFEKLYGDRPGVTVVFSERHQEPLEGEGLL